MKLAYVICTLLCMTLVLADNGASHLTETTTAEPIPSSSVADLSKNAIISNSNTTNGTTPIPTTTVNPNSPTTTTTTPSTTTTTTPSTTTTTTPSTTTTNITTPATTTATPPKTTTVPTTPTTKATTTTHAPTTPTTTPTSTASSITTAVPPSPSSKDRQFDGLSFFGGIILTTCLMAIAAFSWKFYRQCKEGNYRTL